MKKLLLSTFFIASTFASFAQKKQDNHLGKNIISFMPLHAITNNFVGVGLSYERMINDYVGLRVPVMMAVNSPYANVSMELKLYPAKNTRVAAYAIAPMITFGTGRETVTQRYWDNWNQSYIDKTVEYDRSHFGFLLNQTLNFTIAKNFFIGMDGGFGINYFDNNSNPSRNSGVTAIAQFQIMTGVRF